MQLKLFGETDTKMSASARSTPSAKPSSEKTSLVVKSLGTSGRLPTPQARDWKGVRGEHGHSPSVSDVLFSLSAAFPASHSVLPDEDEARRMTAISGLKCLES